MQSICEYDCILILIFKCMFIYFIIYTTFICRQLSNNPLICACELTRGLSDLSGRNITIFGTCKYSTEGLEEQQLSSFVE